MSVYQDNSESIGNTPLVKLNRVVEGNVYLKMESRNPSGSVKCRLGANLIWDAEKKGILTAGKELVEATSGNTGIALAYVAAARGYGITLTMPRSMSLERRKLLKALGAKLELTPAELGMKGAIQRAEELAENEPEKYVLLRQFDNPANPEIHVKTTGPEIEKSLGKLPDVFVAGVGTGGTITGVATYFNTEKGGNVEIIAVEPESSPVITQTMAGVELTPAPHKIQGIGAGFVPKNLDISLVNQALTVSNEDAMAMAHRLMREEGILAGISTGAAVSAIADLLQNNPEYKDKTIVAILPSSAERYLSTPLFENVFSEQELNP
ncbi:MULTISPECIES: cysteine synthase A [Gammaproteobacteria]|uniref:cysteine synthase A n=1 Tax=Gammaproteobacteria TaxID=1236 RepID=UPI000DD01CBC|nr:MULTISPECIES: cysteine synthase A [Gammaproteobacteria]RTE86651.1 cysteine synthase A [Aliidiomarina sp. B3213]TCZ90794.1 cysteine synthase A [Lysobacter sp. N42]